MNGNHLNSAWISDLKYFQTMILTSRWDDPAAVLGSPPGP